jgi:hypothetical protein
MAVDTPLALARSALVVVSLVVSGCLCGEVVKEVKRGKEAHRAADSFIAHLRAGEHEAAYRTTARSYRRKHDLAQLGRAAAVLRETARRVMVPLDIRCKLRPDHDRRRWHDQCEPGRKVVPRRVVLSDEEELLLTVVLDETLPATERIIDFRVDRRRRVPEEEGPARAALYLLHIVRWKQYDKASFVRRVRTEKGFKGARHHLDAAGLVSATWKHGPVRVRYPDARRAVVQTTLVRMDTHKAHAAEFRLEASRVAGELLWQLAGVELTPST